MTSAAMIKCLYTRTIQDLRNKQKTDLDNFRQCPLIIWPAAAAATHCIAQCWRWWCSSWLVCLLTHNRQPHHLLCQQSEKNDKYQSHHWPSQPNSMSIATQSIFPGLPDDNPSFCWSLGEWMNAAEAAVASRWMSLRVKDKQWQVPNRAPASTANSFKHASLTAM